MFGIDIFRSGGSEIQGSQDRFPASPAFRMRF